MEPSLLDPLLIQLFLAGFHVNLLKIRYFKLKFNLRSPIFDYRTSIFKVAVSLCSSVAKFSKIKQSFKINDLYSIFLIFYTSFPFHRTQGHCNRSPLSSPENYVSNENGELNPFSKHVRTL